MKAYGIFPAFDLAAPDDARVQECISLVAEIVCRALRNGDHFHHTVAWHDPGSPLWIGCTEDLAETEIVPLSDPAS